MPEFLNLLPPDNALRELLESLSPAPEVEELYTASALGRITTDAIIAPHSLPSFPRSTVDGYAVRAEDTYGASDSLPAYLKVVGEIPMGAKPDFSIEKSQCALIHTGGMLPVEADGVVMVEHTQPAGEGEVEVMRAVAVGENILTEGEDVKSGQEVIAAGTRLRPAEIGGLMALGITRLTAARKPVVGIISSGDEVISPEANLLPGKVRDVNAYTLSGLIEEFGGVPKRYGILPDQAQALRIAAERALIECNLLIITAGSSASTRDLTAQVIDQLGAPGVLVHGVDVRPGKPTILAVCNGKPVIGLPGNPVSALVIAWLFVPPVLDALQGLRRVLPRPSVLARLTVNLASQAGREDWVAVKLSLTPDGYLAEPVFGKSNLIFTLARANGLVRIPPNATGLAAGEQVEVNFL
jgi:molybdopterin molybdotransferase